MVTSLLFFQAVLNQKFIDCFVLVFLDTQAGKTVGSPSSHQSVCLSVCLVCLSIKLLVSVPESQSGVPRAAAHPTARQYKSSTATGVHVPPPGVGHQHRLLHALDCSAVEPLLRHRTSLGCVAWGSFFSVHQFKRIGPFCVWRRVSDGIILLK